MDKEAVWGALARVVLGGLAGKAGARMGIARAAKKVGGATKAIAKNPTVKKVGRVAEGASTISNLAPRPAPTKQQAEQFVPSQYS